MFGVSNLLYEKIAEDLARDIVLGLYSPGDKLPTVRELAHSHQVNPLTIQKAYSLLEEHELVYARVGSGKYVTNNLDLIHILRGEIIQQVVNEFVEKLCTYNLDLDTIIKLISASYPGGNDDLF